MSNLNPQILVSFNGCCEAAFKFYQRCLNGKIEFLMRWGESPMAKDSPAEWREKILHGRIVIGNMALLGADALPGTYESPRGFSILLDPSEPDEADRLFNVLAENGTVAMPLQETFWARRFGAVTDQFGVTWSINCEAAAS